MFSKNSIMQFHFIKKTSYTSILICEYGVTVVWKQPQTTYISDKCILHIGHNRIKYCLAYTVDCMGDVVSPYQYNSSIQIIYLYNTTGTTGSERETKFYIIMRKRDLKILCKRNGRIFWNRETGTVAVPVYGYIRFAHHSYRG